MSLQRRLTLFFILIVILPLAVAGFVVQRVVVGEMERRALLSVEPALDVTVMLYNDRSESIDERVRAAVGSARFVRLLRQGDAETLERLLHGELLGSTGLDYLIVQERDGAVVASARRAPTFESGIPVPDPSDILESDPGVAGGFVRGPTIPVEFGSREIGSVVGGFWLDKELLVGAGDEEVGLAFVVDDRIVAATADLQDPSVHPDFSATFELEGEGGGSARAVQITEETSLLAWSPSSSLADRARLVRIALVGLLALALVATASLAYFLARLVTRDLDELSRGALAIAQGRFDHRIPIRSRDEVGQLAMAFNDMTERLHETITELQDSRDQLERAVRRVGETLRSTHDMDQILDSILKTAADAVDADAAILWKFMANRQDLQAYKASGLSVDRLGRIRVGQGIVGLVAERGRPRSLPDPDGGPAATRTEPDLPVVVAVPLFSQERVTGVLAVYRADEKRPFSRKDVGTVRFLAEQGGVAIENVTLHEEANRLSLTDGLTGVYNRRYFQMQFRQVMATAVRFDRPFSLLMLDLDHFKRINDTYGHQRGDSVLIEFARRVTAELREVDTFARWGGEEFLCLLPETNAAGAETTAQKILDVIRSEPFGEHGEAKLHITASIGAATFPDHGDDLRSLVEAADQALYLAKQSGRDRLAPAGDHGPKLKLAE